MSNSTDTDTQYSPTDILDMNVHVHLAVLQLASRAAGEKQVAQFSRYMNAAALAGRLPADLDYFWAGALSRVDEETGATQHFSLLAIGLLTEPSEPVAPALFGGYLRGRAKGALINDLDLAMSAVQASAFEQCGFPMATVQTINGNPRLIIVSNLGHSRAMPDGEVA